MTQAHPRPALHARLRETPSASLCAARRQVSRPDETIRHVVMFSGGLGSWAAAKRVAQQHGTDGLVLLFADTRAEEPDVYRFLRDAARNVLGQWRSTAWDHRSGSGVCRATGGGRLVVVCDGRTPWEVFRDTRFLGNARVAKCSRILKQLPCRQWLRDTTVADLATVHVGIDWSEMHRLPAVVAAYRPWGAQAPLCEPPWLDKGQLATWARREGLAPPSAYGEGFPHANCASMCVRAGQAHWKLLLERHPDRYAEAERQEQALRDYLGKPVAILRDRSGGRSRPLTLREFRSRLQCAERTTVVDDHEWGGCGCLPS